MEPVKGPSRKVEHEIHLDAVRGYAALSVALFHVAGWNGAHQFNPSFYVGEPWSNLFSGRGAVLLFFILSGYVIGLTNADAFSPSRAINYLKRRALRIYPVYFLSLTLAFAIRAPDTLLSGFANYAMLQNPNLGIQHVVGNPPLWSLHFEIVYYLFFIGIWFWRPKLGTIILPSIIFSVLDWFWGGFWGLPGGWGSGFIFWVAGLLLAWRVPKNQTDGVRVSVIGALCLVIATDRFDVARLILNGLGFPYKGVSALWLSDFALLPSCFLVIAAATSRHIGIRVLEIVTLLIPAFAVLILASLGRLFENYNWTIGFGYTVVGSLLLWLKPSITCPRALAFLSTLGTISYAIYAFHAPLILAFKDHFLWQPTLASWLGGFALWSIMLLVIAAVADLVIQPHLRSLLERRPLAAAR